MAKADLIHSEDFREYQNDLKARLDMHIGTLHKIIVEPISDWKGSQVKLTRMEATTALIVELETILGLPITYLKKDNELVAAKKKKGAATFMEMFRERFSRGSKQAGDTPETTL
jgi:hypothetical protein